MSDFITALGEQLVEAAERRRRPARPLSWLRPSRPRLGVAVPALIALAIVALAIALALVLRSADQHKGPPATPPQPRSLSGRQLFGGSLQPGVRYRTRKLVPQLSFRVDDKRWFVRDASARDVLVLERRGGDPDRPGGETAPPSAMGFFTLARVFDPAAPPGARPIAAPDDIVAWLRDHPDLRAGRPTPVTVAGLRWLRFDAVVAFTRPRHPDPACAQIGLECTQIAPRISFGRGRFSFLVLERRGAALIISLGGMSRADYDRLVPHAEKVLHSLRVAR